MALQSVIVMGVGASNRRMSQTCANQAHGLLVLAASWQSCRHGEAARRPIVPMVSVASWLPEVKLGRSNGYAAQEAVASAVQTGYEGVIDLRLSEVGRQTKSRLEPGEEVDHS